MGDDSDGHDDVTVINDTRAAGPLLLTQTNVNSATSASSNKFVGKLTTVPPGKTLESHLNNICKRRTAYDSFTLAMQYPIKLLEDRYSKLDLEGGVGSLTFGLDGTALIPASLPTVASENSSECLPFLVRGPSPSILERTSLFFESDT